VRVRNGKVSTTDGPYVETKEQLGGYFLIEAKDTQEAIGIAARIPVPGTAASMRPVDDDQTYRVGAHRRAHKHFLRSGDPHEISMPVYLDEKRLDELPDKDCVDFDTGIRKSGQCLRRSASPCNGDDRAPAQRQGPITDGPFAETKEQLAGFYDRSARSQRSNQVAAKFRPRAWARRGAADPPIRETVAAKAKQSNLKGDTNGTKNAQPGKKARRRAARKPARRSRHRNAQGRARP
jgi:hypothetical protein